MALGCGRRAGCDLISATAIVPNVGASEWFDAAFSWRPARPNVSSVIASVTSTAQVDTNVKAATWQLTPEDLAEVDPITA